MNQEKIGIFIAESRKKKNLTQVELAEKLGGYQTGPYLNGKRVFPKQKDIKKQPMFTCLQTKEYCY